MVKSVDRNSKTMVVNTADGTEHTIKTQPWLAAKMLATPPLDSKVSVKYTEKAGEKTAVGVNDIGKATVNAVQ